MRLQILLRIQIHLEFRLLPLIRLSALRLAWLQAYMLNMSAILFAVEILFSYQIINAIIRNKIILGQWQLQI